MLFDGMTAEARFLAWQAQQECMRSRQIIRATQTEMATLAAMVADTQGMIERAKRRTRYFDRSEGAEQF